MRTYDPAACLYHFISRSALLKKGGTQTKQSAHVGEARIDGLGLVAGTAGHLPGVCESIMQKRRALVDFNNCSKNTDYITQEAHSVRAC